MFVRASKLLHNSGGQPTSGVQDQALAAVHSTLQRLSTISGVFPLAEEALISPGGTTSPEATQHKSVSAPKGIAAMETIAETTMQLILESRKVPKELRLD